MKQGSFAFFPLMGMIMFMALSQVLYKMAGSHVNVHSDPIPAFLFNQWLWFGLFTSALGMVCWLLTLRKLPLSKAYPWTALIYIITPLAGLLLFDETLSIRYLLGLSLIVSGVYFSTGSAAAK